MNISDYSSLFRGKAYTRYKRQLMHKFLAEMLEEGHTITYFPQKGYWAVKYTETEQ